MLRHGAVLPRPVLAVVFQAAVATSLPGCQESQLRNYYRREREFRQLVQRCEPRLRVFRQLSDARTFMSVIWLPDKGYLPVLWYIVPADVKQSRILGVEFVLAASGRQPAMLEGINYWCYRVDRSVSPPSTTVRASLLEADTFWDALERVAHGEAVGSLPSIDEYTIDLVPQTDLWEVVFGAEASSESAGER